MGSGFVIVGLNSSPLGWVGFAAVGLDIHHGFHLLSLGCIHQVGLSSSPLGWIHCGWVGFTAVGFHSLLLGLAVLGWICRCRVGFAVVGLYSLLLGTHSLLSGCIRPRCAQFSLIGPLADVGCVGFAIVDPTRQCWVQPIAVGLVGCDFDRFSLAKVEELSEMEKDDQTKNRSGLSS